MSAPPRRRSLSASLLGTVGSNVAVPLSALLTGPLLARELAPEGRGELAAVLAPVALVVLLLTFGLPESLTYHVASRRIPLRTAVRAAVALGAGCGVLAAVLVVALGPLLLHRFPDVHGLLYALAATLPLIMGLGMLRHVAQGAQAFELPNRERWVGTVSRVVLLVALAAGGALTVTSAAWATHGTAVLATGLLLAIALRHRPARDTSPSPSVRAVAPALVRFGLRTWPGTLSGILILRLDQVLIAPLAGARQLGLFAVAVSVAELPGTALLAVRDIMFAASTDRGDPRLVAEATRLVVLLAGPLCLVGIVLTLAVVPLLFGDDFRDAIPMAQVLLAAAVPSGVALILTGGLLGAGHPGTASGVQLFAAAATVAGLVLTVPGHGAIAAAWTALASRVIAAGLSGAALVRLSEVRASECFVPRASDARRLVERLRSLLAR